MIKSHEFISKTVLKNFVVKDKGGFYTYYAHLPKERVGYGDIEDLNTRFGAYTNDNETALHKDFETHLGEVQDAFRKAQKKNMPFDVSCVKPNYIFKYFANQYWRDDTFVKEVSIGVESLSGLPMRDVFGGYTLEDMDGLKNFFLAEEHNQQPKSQVFDKSVIYVGIDKKGRLIGHSYPITVRDNDSHIATALTLSPNIIFIQVYYKKLDKNNLHKIYVNKVWDCIELTDDVVDAFNRIMVTLGRRLETGYVVSRTKGHLRSVLLDAHAHHDD